MSLIKPSQNLLSIIPQLKTGSFLICEAEQPIQLWNDIQFKLSDYSFFIEKGETFNVLFLKHDMYKRNFCWIFGLFSCEKRKGFSGNCAVYDRQIKILDID